jgi:hypothetical protein
MANCAKCGGVLIAAAKFCGTCGARVTAPSLPPPPSPAPRTSVPSADPFAKTVFGGDTGPIPPPPSPQPPQARSAPPPTGAQPQAVPQPRTQPHQAAYVPPARPASNPPTAAHPAAPGPAAPPPTPIPTSGAFQRGSTVLVHWADGNRYPATVLHVQGNHVLVAFPTGQQQWVDGRYVSNG